MIQPPINLFWLPPTPLRGFRPGATGPHQGGANLPYTSPRLRILPALSGWHTPVSSPHLRGRKPKRHLGYRHHAGGGYSNTHFLLFSPPSNPDYPEGGM